MNPYEDSKLLGEYLLFHYGKDEDIMPWTLDPKAACTFPKEPLMNWLIPAIYLPSKSTRICCAGSLLLSWQIFMNMYLELISQIRLSKLPVNCIERVP